MSTLPTKPLKASELVSPFIRLETLLASVSPPPKNPIDMSVGAPLQKPPNFVSKILQAHAHEWSIYPPTIGTVALRNSIVWWLKKRFGVCAEIANVLPVCGTREALFALAPLALRRFSGNTILVPTPAYQCYRSAALWAGAKPVEVVATQKNGFLPRFTDLSSANVLKKRVRCIFAILRIPKALWHLCLI